MYHRGMNRAFIAFAVLASCSCTSCDRFSPIWGTAPIRTVRQSQCNSSSGRPAIEATATPDGISVVDRNVSFVCGIVLHVLLRRGRKTLDVLVEPMEKHPTNMAKCLCSYDMRFEIDGLAKGTYELNAYQRDDQADSANRVASTTVTVP
jgi:hypothetical protein